MKKNLYLMFAAAAIACSCSQNDEVASNTDETTLEPIKIGLSYVSTGLTRGTGTVGAVGEETNQWAGQSVNVYMLNKNTTEIARFSWVDPETSIENLGYEIYNNAVLTTPAGTNTGEADYVQDGTAVTRYYPTSGDYDFWGYRLDDAATGEPATDADGKTIAVDFTIDGSQDIMVAKADAKESMDDLVASGEITSENADRYYSAFSARRGVQPELKFRHLLTRLTFTAKASNEDLCDEVNGIKINSIYVKSKATGKLVVAYTPDYTGEQLIFSDEEPARLAIKQRQDGENPENLPLVDLEEVIPQWDENGAVVSQIGEALLVAPQDEYEIEINMSQLPNTVGATEPIPFQYKTTITMDGGFKAGYSYNVAATLYGLERIVITTTLEPWISGGDDINIDAEY